MKRAMTVAVICLLMSIIGTRQAHAAWLTDGNAMAPFPLPIPEFPKSAPDGSGGAIITWQDNRGGNYDIYVRRVDASGTVLWALAGIAICDATDDQISPQIIPDGSGGAIITWQDNRGGNSDIYAQRVDANGTVLWTPDGVAICDATNDQKYPQITTDGVDGAIITWQDNRSGPFEIYVQRVDANGVIHSGWTANGVSICNSAYWLAGPQITPDGSEGAIITWQDNRGENYDIYAQRVDANGAVLWTPGGVAICDATNYQRAPQIISDGSGGAIITWQDERDGGIEDYDIYTQRVNGSGTVLWTVDGVAICTGAYQKRSPYAISDGSGGAIITWDDMRSGVHPHIYAQRVDASGVAQWTGGGILLSSSDAYIAASAPRSIPDGSGGAIITWYDFRDTYWPDYDAYAQRVNGNGTVLWTISGIKIGTGKYSDAQDYIQIIPDGAEGAIITWGYDGVGIRTERVNVGGTVLWGNVVVCYSANSQVNQQIISDGSGGAIITWEDYRGGYSNCDIYAQRVDAIGTVLWAVEGLAICTATGSQASPQIIPDGLGGAIITWGDAREGVSDIYAQRVDAIGTVLWADEGVAICAETGSQAFPQIIPDGSGGAIIAWQDAREGVSDIYAQRVDESGVPQWTEDGVAICAATGSQASPQIIPDGSEGAIITWEDYRGGNMDIYARRIDASGVAQWTEDGVAVCAALYNQTNPQIASDGFGGAIITWENSYSSLIYAQRVNWSGMVLWMNDGIRISPYTYLASAHRIIPDGSGGAIITWESVPAGYSDIDVYAQRIDASGIAQWTGGGVAICTATNQQENPQIIPDGSGGGIITWQDAREGLSDIYTQRVNRSGTFLWQGGGVAICTAANDQQNPQIIPDGSGGAIITWMDLRSESYQVYAGRITGSSGGICDIDPRAIDLPGSIPVGSSQDASFTITNIGIGTLYGSVTESSDQFRIVSGGGDFLVSNNQSLVVTVRFEPTVPGMHECTIETGIYICGDVTITGTAWQAPTDSVVYVDAGATGLDAGNSWANAFTELSDALEYASSFAMPGTQTGPLAVADNAGGSIVAWIDYRDGSPRVFCQRVGSLGQMLWTAAGIPICSGESQQWSFDIIPDGAGGAIITWWDVNPYDRILVQRLDANGSRLWTDAGIAVCDAEGQRWYPRIAPDGAGGAIITWQDRRPASSWDIYAQRVNGNGVPQWTPDGIAICSEASFDQGGPRIVTDGASGAIIVWDDSRDGKRYFYGQRVDADGAPLWTPDGVGIVTTGEIGDPLEMIPDGSGGAIIVWQIDVGWYDVWAQRIDSNHQPLWGTNGVAVGEGEGHQKNPKVVSDTGYGAIIVWEDNRNGSYDIYLRRVDAAGGPLGIPLICTAAGDQVDPRIIYDGQGAWIISWKDFRNGGADIFAQKINVAGGLLWTTNGDAICQAAGIQGNPQLVPDDSGGAIIVWEDERSDADMDVYGQRVSTIGASGVAQWAANGVPIASGIQMWVAEGTYKPTGGGDRAATFQMRSGLAIYGGFAGTETQLSQRDASNHVTILSGDIGAAGNADNSYHVVTASGTNNTAVLDGFTVTGGNANGAGEPDMRGGGMLCIPGSPVIANVRFRDNAASYGGGIYISGDASLTSVIFSDNSAEDGGGIYNDKGSLALVNVLFHGNSATAAGGGMSNHCLGSAAVPSLTNVTFSGNSAGGIGGGMYNVACNLSMINTIMWGDAAPSGAELFNDYGSVPAVSYSLVQGCGGSGAGWVSSIGADGGNNLDADPLFVAASTADFRLMPGSPAIDAGNSAAPGLPSTDLAGLPRVLGDAVDMGVYEDGVAPLCRIEPSEVDFCAAIQVGEQADASFTISNDGVGTLVGNIVESCDQFRIILGGGNFLLSNGQSRIVTLRFEPTAPGIHSCSIETGTFLCGEVPVTGAAIQVPVDSVVYVDKDATGGGGGSSWANAFTELRDALVSVPLGGLPGDQANPVIVADGAHGAIVAWLDYRLPDGYARIFAQRVDMSGNVLWSSSGVQVCTANARQFSPQIISDGALGAIITWYDDRAGYDIYAQRINANGSLLWGPSGIAVCTAAGLQAYPQIVSDGAGGAIITWQDGRDGDWDVYAQRVNANGVVQWSANGVAVSAVPGVISYEPRIASDGYGGALVAWQDDRNGSFDIFIRRIMGNGGALATLAVCTAPGSQAGQQIVPVGSDAWVVCWQDARADGWDVYAQKFNITGSLLWGTGGVSVCSAAADQEGVRAIPDGTGGVIVTWEDYRNGSSDPDIYARRVDTGGTTQWANDGVAVSASAYREDTPRIVSDGSGGAIIAWADYRSGDDNCDIYAQRVDASGALQWASSGSAICIVSGHQQWPEIVPDGYGGVIAAWQDAYRLNWDIRAQRINMIGGTQWVISGIDLVWGMQVWVAEGTYTPTATTDRAVSFGLRGGLAVYGGFAGTETARDQRDVDSHVTVLSGDIGVAGINTDNSYHVVTFSGTSQTSTALLDGFTVSGGYANGSNNAQKGGGVFSLSVSGIQYFTVDNLMVRDNYAAGEGGGMYFGTNTRPTVRNTVIEQNTGGQGGGMMLSQARASLLNVSFIGNEAGYGGGLRINGGEYNTYANLLFHANRATSASGGALYYYQTVTGTTPNIRNATFSMNTAATAGGAIALVNYARLGLVNCVLWDDDAATSGDEVSVVDYAYLTTSYSMVAGSGGSGAGWNPSFGIDGGNNLDANPSFYDESGGDLRLLEGSPAIDAGNNSPAGGLPTTDLAGNARIQDGIVDMGAYEGGVVRVFSHAQIDSIADVPGDQGGWVRIYFTRSLYDNILEQVYPIARYDIHRRVDDPELLSGILAGGEVITGEHEAALSGGEKVLLAALSSDAGSRYVRYADRYYIVNEVSAAAAPPGVWEVIGNVSAQQEDQYIRLSPTLGDSTETMFWSVFYISAHTTTPSVFFASPPDSGYSVDNLAPGVPQHLEVAYNTGTGNHLEWDPCGDPDFQYFKIYRGTEADFIPAPENKVHETASTQWTDPEYDGWEVYYKVAAVDHAGNESDPASPSIITDAGWDKVPRAYALYQNVPNPFNPETAIRFDVPSSGGFVTLKVYDVSGRLVRALVEGTPPPGQKTVSWDGRNEAGQQVASGIYFYRLEAAGFTETRKMVLLR